MLIRKEKNYTFIFILGLILIVIGLIYGLLKKNIGILLLLLIFGLFFIGIAIYKNLKRYQHFKKLKELIAKEKFYLGRIVRVSTVNSYVAKSLKEKVYEFYVETKIAEKNIILTSEWLEKEDLDQYKITPNREIKIAYFDNNNYYFFL